MLTLRQSPFDLFERLEQQLATAERVPNAEIRETETSYTVQLELPGVDRKSIDIKATDRNLVISAERPATGIPRCTDRVFNSNRCKIGEPERRFIQLAGCKIGKPKRRFV